MIDTLPALPGKTSASVPGLAAVPSQTGTDAAAAAVSNGVSFPLPTSPAQATFASALQGRLKLMALNTEERPATNIAVQAGKQADYTNLPPCFADARLSTAQPIMSSVPMAKADPLAPTGPADKHEYEQPEDIATNQADVTSVTTPSADAAAIPMALAATPPLNTAPPPPVAPSTDKETATGNPRRNTPALSTSIATLPSEESVPKTPAQPTSAAPTSVNSDAPDKQTGQTPAAILATSTEKMAAPAANHDKPSGEASFAETLRNVILPTGNESISAKTTSAIDMLPVRQIATPVGTPHWSADVGNQLNWMVSQRESRADLVLNPPQLGRIEVSITLNGDQVSASLVSGNPEIREALQGSLPRLREILADAGISLGQAHIGAESFGQGGSGAEKSPKSPDDSFSTARQTLLGSPNGPTSTGGAPVARGQGLIDLFA